MNRNSCLVLQSSFVLICTCSDLSCPIFPIDFVATHLTWHLHFDGIPTQLLRYDPSASLWRYTTLHSGLPGVRAGQCNRNLVEGISSRNLFSYINLQNPPLLLSHKILSSPYPIVLSLPIGSGIQVLDSPVVQANLCITPSLFPIYFDHSLFAMGVIDAILTASKLVASLSQTATNGTAFIIFPSQEEFEIDVQT